MAFKYLNQDKDVFDAEDAEDLYASKMQLDDRLAHFETALEKLDKDAPVAERIEILLAIARVQLERHQGKEAWRHAFLAFTLATDHAFWEDAVLACDILFAAEGPESLKALGHGIWIGVTFPIDAEITVLMLQHLIDESPKDSDTRAIAAACAHYIASFRSGEKSQLTLFTSQMLSAVAGSHSHITDQKSFNVWHRALALDDPAVFLPKLSGAVSQLIGENWWIDKDAIHKTIQSQN